MTHQPQPPSWPPDLPAPAHSTGGERSTNKQNATEISEAELMLGKLALFYATELRVKGWRTLVSETRGYSNISPKVQQLQHKAAQLVKHLGQRGASVTLHTSPWSAEQTRTALTRGPHKTSHSKREFVSEEILDFCRQGYWLVLPQNIVIGWPHLRVSPLGVVPQWD